MKPNARQRLQVTSQFGEAAKMSMSCGDRSLDCEIKLDDYNLNPNRTRARSWRCRKNVACCATKSGLKTERDAIPKFNET